MRFGFTAVLGLVGLLTLGGCSHFSGEWLEEGKMGPNGLLLAPDGSQRLVLKFSPPINVQYGFYSEHMKVVDETSVQADFYFVYSGRKTAGFGEMIARRDGDDLLVTVDDAKPMRFTRVKGKSIFPPRVRGVTQAKPAPGSDPAVPQTEAVYASTK